MGSVDEYSAATVNWPEVMSMGQILESVERAVLVEASKNCRNQQEVAEGLDMSQPTVARKLQKYGIVIGAGKGY
jgi:DNA-binding NtrC family response regulator